MLLRDEQVESFEWVFTEFVRMMGSKPPITILAGNKDTSLIIKQNYDISHGWFTANQFVSVL